MTRLQTERLILRPPESGDVPALATALNDFEITKNLALVPHPYTTDDAAAYVVRAAEDWASGQTYRFVMRRITDDHFVGCCGLHREDRALELGYWIAKPLWRQGYASEATRRVATFAFDELGAKLLTAGWYHDNGISSLVLAKLGFKAVGVEKAHCVARGHAVLCNRTMLTREQFGRKKAA